MNISRLGIGTVQFGGPYGINNKTGRVPPGEVTKILETAILEGINFIDTHRGYGGGIAEEQIGPLSKEFIICTQPIAERGLDIMRRSLPESLEALKLDFIPYYIIYSTYWKHYREHMMEVKEKGLVKHIGISVIRGPGDALECMEDLDIEIIQIPYNTFDQRWKKVIDVANEKKIKVFNRSSYLQGLLLMNKKEMEEKLPRAVQYKGKLEGIAMVRKYKIKELALKYVLNTPGITSSVVGIDSLKQFKENIAISRDGDIDGETRRLIKKQFANVPENIVDPALWRKE